MYDKETTNNLTSEYLKGKRDVINKLLENLSPMVDVVLAKGYSARREYWEDLRQETLLELLKIIGRKPLGLKIAASETWENASGIFLL